MASKRAQRRRSCEGKQKHPDRWAAQAHRYKLEKTQGALGLTIYRCRFCGQWHVGHIPEGTRRKIQDRKNR